MIQNIIQKNTRIKLAFEKVNKKFNKTQEN